jgi:hypothetical protein
MRTNKCHEICPRCVVGHCGGVQRRGGRRRCVPGRGCACRLRRDPGGAAAGKVPASVCCRRGASAYGAVVCASFVCFLFAPAQYGTGVCMSNAYGPHHVCAPRLYAGVAAQQGGSGAAHHRGALVASPDIARIRLPVHRRPRLQPIRGASVFSHGPPSVRRWGCRCGRVVWGTAPRGAAG